MRDFIQIEKLDNGFIVTERTDRTSARETAYTEKEKESILQKIAFFITRQVGINASFDNLKNNAG